MKNINLITTVLCIFFMLTSCKDLELIPVQCPEVTAISPSSGFFNTEVELTVAGLSHDKSSFYEVKIQGATIPIEEFDATTGKFLITIPKGTRTGKVTVNYKASTGFDMECSAEAQEGMVFEYMPKVGSPRVLASDATSGFLIGPAGIDVDGNGKVYVAESNNNRILSIDHETGVVSNYIGTGGTGCHSSQTSGESSILADPVGLAIDKKKNNIFITEIGNYTVRKINISSTRSVYHIGGECGGNDGFFQHNQFRYPQAVGVTNDGEVLVVDLEDHGIRQLTPKSDNPNQYTLSNFAGKNVVTDNCSIQDDNIQESATFCDVSDITIIESGDSPVAYVTEFSDASIRVIENGAVSTLSLTVNSGELVNPAGITDDGNGNLYIADFSSKQVLRVDLYTNKLFAISQINNLSGPIGIAFDQARNLLYVSDNIGRKVIQIEIE